MGEMFNDDFDDSAMEPEVVPEADTAVEPEAEPEVPAPAAEPDQEKPQSFAGGMTRARRLEVEAVRRASS